MAQNDLPDWHVLGDQVARDTTLAEGRPGIVTYWKVPYQIDAGPARGSIQTLEVRPEDFTPAKVEELIRQHLAIVHGVALLGNAGA